MNVVGGFWSELGQLLPLALAGTFSWLPVTGVVLLLLSGDGRAKAPAFLVGRVLGLALLTVAFVVGARALPPVPRLEGPLVGGTEVAAGAALVLIGFLTWHGRHRARHHEAPAFLRKLAHASPAAVFVTSLLVDLQPKGLLLGLSAGVVLRAASLPPLASGVAILVYLVVASSSVLLPVLAMYVAPVRTERWLRTAQDWLVVHGPVVTAAVAALVGVLLVSDGLGRF